FGGTDLIEQNFYAANHNLLDGDGFDTVRQRLGITATASFNPLFGYKIGESTLAGYVMGKFEVDGPVRIDGNVGTRIVRTNLNVNGT
ncbi:hypothetical protein ABTN27_21010, partial [Acinetobacter baumannii]